MRHFLGKSTRIETLALIISIVFVFGSTPVLARGGGHGGGHGHMGGHRGHTGGHSSVFSHRAAGSFIRPAWHSWRFHHHHLLIFPLRFPIFGSSFYGYTCYGPFWPFFSYNPCRNYYGWTTPYTDLISPLGNKLAGPYAPPGQLDLPEETKDAEQVESSRESNEFVRSVLYRADKVLCGLVQPKAAHLLGGCFALSLKMPSVSDHATSRVRLAHSPAGRAHTGHAHRLL